MKVLIRLWALMFLLSSYSISAQESRQRYVPNYTKDQLSFSFHSTQLLHKQQSLSISGLSRGVSIKLMAPILGNRRAFDIALGAGLTFQNYYLNSFIFYSPDSIWFTPIPEDLDYRKYKLNTNYLMLPLELRFRSRPDRTNRSFKFYPGFRFAYLISNKTKYIGENALTGESEKIKLFDYPFLSRYDYGITLRMGYGKMMVHAYYSLSYLIEPGRGIDLKPLEVGLTVFIF